MTLELKQALKLADQHIQAHQYAEALAVLLPYQDQPAAANQIKALKRKRAELVQRQAPRRSSRGRKTWILIVIGAAVLVEVAVVVIILGRDATRPVPMLPTVALIVDQRPVSVAATAPAPTITDATPVAVLATPQATVYENLQEAGLQDEILDELLLLFQARKVFLFDVDHAPDGGLVVYLEMEVYPGTINDDTLNEIFDIVDDELEAPDYSDFEIILSDRQSMVEFIFNNQTRTWNQTVLSGSDLATAAP